MLTSPRQRAWATRQDGDEESNERVPAGAIAHIKWMIDRFYARISGHHLEQSVLHLTQKLKKANRELARKNDRLTELATTAHRFVDNVAHEFRTPLTVIQEFTSILDDGIGGTLSQEQRKALALKTPSLNQHIQNLSGGNQQKVLISRWLLNLPEILMLDEPTRGIDVGAKAEIFALLDRLVHDGAGILMISSEQPALR